MSSINKIRYYEDVEKIGNNDKIKYRQVYTFGDGNCLYYAIYGIIQNHTNIIKEWELNDSSIEQIIQKLRNKAADHFFKNITLFFDKISKKEIILDQIKEDPYFNNITDLNIDTEDKISSIQDTIRTNITTPGKWAGQTAINIFKEVLLPYKILLSYISLQGESSDILNEPLKLTDQICNKINSLKQSNSINNINNYNISFLIHGTLYKEKETETQETNVNHYNFLEFNLNNNGYTPTPKYIDFFNVLDNKGKCPMSAEESISPFAAAAATPFSIQSPIQPSIINLIQSMIGKVSSALQSSSLNTTKSRELNSVVSFDALMQPSSSPPLSPTTQQPISSSSLTSLLATTNQVLTQIASNKPALQTSITPLQSEIKKITSNPSIVTIEYLTKDFLPPLIAFLQSIPTTKGGKKKGFKEHRRKYVK